MMSIIKGTVFILLFSIIFVSALKREDCEVCFGTIERFISSLPPSDNLRDHKEIEEEFRKFCLTTKSREHRFCYYLGGLEDSATGILSELSKPIVNSFPIDKICERLLKKDSQICDLRYEKVIDLKTVDLKKLRVKDLKNILNEWDETCNGCIEKADFISRIEELKPQYVREEL